MPTYQRKQIPYNPAEVLPFSNRYALVAEQDQPINSNQLDGDFNYIIDSLNDLWTITQGIAAGILPGSSSPLNINKFPVTDGAGTISWTNITSGYFSAQCITTLALQNGCVTNPKIGNGAVGNENIQAGAIQNNNIEDDKISFDKIAAVNNSHFQLFFNTQADSTLSGSKIQAGSLPANTIAAGSLPGTAITTGTLPSAALVNNSITSLQLSPLIKPLIGGYFPWGAPAGVAVPAGYVEGNGQLLNVVTYALLFAIYGTTYGGDGVTNFGTPDLRGRCIFFIDPASPQPTGGRIVNGTIAVGATGGEESHTLTVDELAPHSHAYTTPAINLYQIANGMATNRPTPAPGQTDVTGGGQPHNNMTPYILNRILIYAGV